MPVASGCAAAAAGRRPAPAATAASAASRQAAERGCDRGRGLGCEGIMASRLAVGSVRLRWREEDRQCPRRSPPGSSAAAAARGRRRRSRSPARGPRRAPEEPLGPSPPWLGGGAGAAFVALLGSSLGAGFSLLAPACRLLAAACRPCWLSAGGAGVLAGGFRRLGSTRARFRPRLRRLRRLPGPCCFELLGVRRRRSPSAGVAALSVGAFGLLFAAAGREAFGVLGDGRVAFRDQVFGRRGGRQREQRQRGGDGDRDGSQAHGHLHRWKRGPESAVDPSVVRLALVA